MGKLIRYKMIFTGRVQGVGFRYKAKSTADMYRLTGYVKNEHDGSVVVEIQGEQSEIDMFLQTLNRDRYIDIDGMLKEMLSIEEDERSFIITY